MLLLYFSFLGTGLETLCKVRSSPYGVFAPLMESNSPWKKLSVRQVESLISSRKMEVIKIGYSSWIHPVEKTDSTPHFFYRHSAIPLLVFEDNRICEPVIIEIDHE